ncbi:DUF5677 domain-containing protein [Chloroflexota bacterium]
MKRDAKKKVELGTQEFTNQLFQYYGKQSDLIQQLYQYQFEALKNNPNERVDSLYLLLFSMHDTGQAVGMLAANQKINESYMLARALLERIINYIYLLYCDEEDYKRYLLYTKQKSYRNLNKNIKVGELIAELKWTGDFNLEKDPELKKAVDLFTSEKGKSISRWTNKSIVKMLNIIEQKSDIDIRPLMLSMLAIYDDASEALHGTLYGTIFQIGLFSAGNMKTKKQIVRSVHGQLSLLFLALGSCIDSLILAINKVFPIDEIKVRSKENLDNLNISDEKRNPHLESYKVNITKPTVDI